MVPKRGLLPRNNGVYHVIRGRLPLVNRPPLPRTRSYHTSATKNANRHRRVRLRLQIRRSLLTHYRLNSNISLIPRRNHYLGFRPIENFRRPLIRNLRGILFTMPSRVRHILCNLVMILTTSLSTTRNRTLTSVNVRTKPPLTSVLKRPLTTPKRRGNVRHNLNRLPNHGKQNVKTSMFNVILLLLRRGKGPKPNFPNRFSVTMTLIVLRRSVMLKNIHLSLANFRRRHLRLTLTSSSIRHMNINSRLTSLIIIKRALTRVLTRPSTRALNFTSVGSNVTFIPSSVRAKRGQRRANFLVRFYFNRNDSSMGRGTTKGRPTTSGVGNSGCSTGPSSADLVEPSATTYSSTPSTVVQVIIPPAVPESEAPDELLTFAQHSSFSARVRSLGSLTF